MNKFKKLILIPSAQEIKKQRKWIEKEIDRIGEEALNKLIDAAVKVRSRAYAPYSHYKVGASILCTSGNVYSGTNTEVVNYSETGHAESNTMNKAISEGEAKKGRKFIRAVAVCQSGESGPCGACRQEIIEHCDNAIIIDVDPNGTPCFVTSLGILLTYSFNPTHLGK